MTQESTSTSRSSFDVCMICVQNVPQYPVKIEVSSDESEVLTSTGPDSNSNSQSSPPYDFDKVFHVFCDYMNLKTCSNIRFNSSENSYPFCMVCIKQVFQLYEFHIKKQSLADSITKLVCFFTAKIIENSVQPLKGRDITLVPSSLSSSSSKTRSQSQAERQSIKYRDQDSTIVEGQEQEGEKNLKDVKFSTVSGNPIALTVNEIAGLQDEIVKRYSAQVKVEKLASLEAENAAELVNCVLLEGTRTGNEGAGNEGEDYDGEEFDFSGEYPSNSSNESWQDKSVSSCLTDTDSDEEEFDDEEFNEDYQLSLDDPEYIPSTNESAKKAASTQRKRKADDTDFTHSHTEPREMKHRKIDGTENELSDAGSDITSSKKTEFKPKSKPCAARVAKEIGPNKYALGEFTFERVDGEYKCGSCIKTHVLRKRMMYHVKEVHLKYAEQGIASNRLIEIAPDKFLYGDLYPAVKESRKYKCETCGFKSVRKGWLAKHLELHLSGVISDDTPDPTPRTFICEMCGKVLATSGTLYSHRKSHSDERNFQCEVCANTYKSAQALKTHMEIHQGDVTKKFVCEVCGYRTRRGNKLKFHMAKHSREKIYECPEPGCDKKFAWPAAVDYHKRSHNPENRIMYSCDFCDMTFKCKSSIPRHVRVIHNGEKSSEVFKRAEKIESREDDDSGNVSNK